MVEWREEDGDGVALADALDTLGESEDGASRAYLGVAAQPRRRPRKGDGWGFREG